MAVLGRWQLHPLHLYLVRSYLKLEDLTLPLEGPAYGATTEQLGQIAQREYPAMVEFGLLVDNEVHPQLADALKLLTKPYLWVDSMWFPEFGGEACWRTVAVLTEGNRIVLGVQTPGETDRFGGMLTVEVHDKVHLPQVILPTLPPAPPGNRGAVKVPEGSFRPKDTDDTFERGSYLQQAPGAKNSSGDRQMALYKEIGEAVHVRTGQIAANLRDTNGRVKRSPVLRWFDNADPDGRYLTGVERANTGEQMYTITPADSRLLHAQIDGLITSVR